MWYNMLPLAALVGFVSGIPCEDARLKCAYRNGCGKALQNYLMGCSDVLRDIQSTHCPEICQHSLIALISTNEGKALMDCECKDSNCEEQKRGPEICRPEVTKIIESPVVSCRVAQWICNADAQCSTAFEYYRRNCKAMFHGKKCTPKCSNSISILRRQTKATHLKTCKCDGTEDYDCVAIQRNMNKLCFHNHHRYNVTKTKLPTNEEIPTVIVQNGSTSPRYQTSVALVWFMAVLLWTR
ncbi:uncharacterized protein LOC143194868 isoform X2 [Rhynchophorus ferrugineus]|uniref:GDNF/GAS1 domain-containing protein n=1 Tax=Rhynchophorus ferrugineus TaxID=354439 RepID=A0A834M1D0_RHYFE|nr:hypothetical protein GWI33_019487 [Rhynchophorus ferrugineus]